MFSYLKSYSIENAVAFLSVFACASVMVLFGEFELEVSYWLYLPLGAKILMYLLYGYRVFPGILAACIATGVLLFNSWNGNLLIGSMAACAGAIAPIIAMIGMKLARICDLSNLYNIDFRNVIVLVATTSVVSALLKYFVYMQDLTLTIDAFDFITHYITGDVLGSITVIYLVLKVLVPSIEKRLNSANLS